MIPEPEGFDLRDRRSEKSGKGSEWLPCDALYSAWQKTSVTEPGAEPACLFVAWKDAAGVTWWCAAGTIEQIDSLLLRVTLDRRA